MCDPAVPCGVVATQVLKNAGITVHPAASLADVKSALAAVESGEVDAGLVYVTDVRAAGTKVKGIGIPAAVNASTTYPIAVLKDARNATLAREWVDLRAVGGRSQGARPRTASWLHDARRRRAALGTPLVVVPPAVIGVLFLLLPTAAHPHPHAVVAARRDLPPARGLDRPPAVGSNHRSRPPRCR